MDQKKINKFYNFNIKSTDEDKREITAIGSKEVIDRDGELVKISGMSLTNFKKNPVILWSHQYSELPVGKAVKVSKNGDELRFKIQFCDETENPKASYVYKLLKNKYLNTFSVGFIPDYKSITFPEKADGKKIPYRIIERSELLELSVCPVPSNPSALLSSVKGYQKAWEDGVIDTEEKKSLDDDLEDYVKILEEGDKENQDEKDKIGDLKLENLNLKKEIEVLKNQTTKEVVDEETNIYKNLLDILNEDGNENSTHTSKIEDDVDYDELLDNLKEEK